MAYDQIRRQIVLKQTLNNKL